MMSLIIVVFIFILSVEVLFWSFSINRHSIWLKKHPSYDRRLAVPYRVLSFAGTATALLALSLWVLHVYSFSLLRINSVTPYDFYIKSFFISWTLLSIIHLWGIVSRYSCLHSNYWPIISGKISQILVKRFGITEINKYCSTMRKWNDLDKLSEKHKKLLFKFADRMNDFIWTKDNNKRYTYVNASLGNSVLLYDQVEAVGMTHKEIADNHRLGGMLYNFDETSSASDNMVLSKKVIIQFIERGIIDGNEIVLRVTKAPIFVDGKITGIIGMGRNITNEVSHLDEIEYLLFNGDCEKAKEKFNEYKDRLLKITL